MNPSLWTLTPCKRRYSYYADFPFFRRSNDYHETFAIYFLEAGAFSYRIGSGEAEILEEGELVICPPHTNFAKSVVRTVTFHLVNLDFTEPCELPPMRLSWKDDRRIAETLAGLRGLLSQRTLPTERYREHLADDLWYAICARSESPFVHFEQHAADPFFREMTAYIAEHPGTSLCELAAVFCTSRVTVNHCFRRETGGTAGDYITKARVERACRLILQTDEPFKNLAPACGFSSEYYFNSVFRRVTGVTPGEYRRQCKKRQI